MFNKGRNGFEDSAPPPPPRPRDAAGGRGTTFSIIGSDVTIRGNLSATVDIHIDGRVEGDLACASLVQGAASVIQGAVQAESARIAGTVEGSIDAVDLVIERTARVTGDVAYQNLTIEQGGSVEGQFRRKSSDIPSIARQTVALPRENDTLELTASAG